MYVFSGDAAHRLAFERGRLREHNAAVDHHIVRDDLEAEPWESTGEIIRADEAARESVDDWFGQEYYMFYGGHRVGSTTDAALSPRR